MASLLKVVLSRPMVHLVKPQLVGGEPVGCFTSVAQDLNSGITRTNNTVQRSNHLASLAQVIPWRYIIDETCNEHSFTVADFLLPFLLCQLNTPEWSRIFKTGYTYFSYVVFNTWIREA